MLYFSVGKKVGFYGFFHDHMVVWIRFSKKPSCSLIPQDEACDFLKIGFHIIAAHIILGKMQCILLMPLFL